MRLHLPAMIFLIAATGAFLVSAGPPLVTSADLASDKYLDKFVRFEGRVTDQFHDESNAKYNFLTLEDAYGVVYFSASTNRCPDLTTNNYVGCRVSVCGDNKMAIRKPNGTRKYLFHELQCPPHATITVLEAPTGDPFNVPELAPTFNVAPDQFASMGNRKLSGLVLAVRAPNAVLLLTPNDTVSCVTLRDAALPQAGDFIEAVGPVETDTYFLNMTRARWRKTSSIPIDVPTPKMLTARQITKQGDGQQIFNVALHGRLIRIRSVVRSLPDPKFGNCIIFAESDGVTFPIDASSCPIVVEELKHGSIIDVTGICWMDIENWRPTAVFPQVKDFTLVPRMPEDFVVVAHPPWWTPARLMGVIGSLSALLLGFVIWNRSLRHAARMQGRQLFREQATRMEAELKTAERSRLAVELHDSISQTLTGVALKIKAVQTQARTDLDKALKNLDIAENTLRASREELRYCLWDLRNNILDLPNLEEAIRQTLKPQIGDVELAVRFSVPRSSLSDNTIHVVLSIIRELSVNAIRHGEATSIHIAGTLDNDILAFSVQDNGSGFELSAAPGPDQGHFGLLGIKDRLAHYNGAIEIASVPGKGTKAKVRLAVNADMETEMS